MADAVDFRDGCVVVTQILRCLVLEGGVIGGLSERAYTKRAPRRPANANQHAVAEKVLDRTSWYQ